MTLAITRLTAHASNHVSSRHKVAMDPLRVSGKRDS